MALRADDLEDDAGDEGPKLVKLPPGVIYKPSVKVLQEAMRTVRANRSSLWKPQMGPNKIRVLPPFSEALRFFAIIPQHWNVGPDSRVCMCLEYVDQTCYICEMREQLLSSRNAEDHKLVDDTKARPAFLLNIIDMKDVDSGVQVYSCSETFFVKLNGIFADPEYQDFTDPEEGFNLNFTGSAAGKGVKAGDPNPERNPSPIAYKNWHEELKDLDHYFRVPTRQYQQDCWEGKTNRS